MKKIDWSNHLINFLAVILGVFLAFYVSNRAEKRKERAEVQEIMQSLADDLESDQNSYANGLLPTNEAQLQQLNLLVENVLSGNQDSARNQLPYVLQLENYYPGSATYLSMSSSGKINLIDNLELKNELSYYYDMLANEAKAKGQAQTDFFLNEIIPWLMDNADLADLSTAEVAGRKDFSNRLIIYTSLLEGKLRDYEHIHKAAKSLKKKVEANIKGSDKR